MKRKFGIVFIVVTLVFAACKQQPKSKEVALNTTPILHGGINWKPTQDYYLEHITTALNKIQALDSLPMTGEATQKVFEEARLAFKKAEPYASYLNPSVGHRANGPALPIVTDDSQRILLPIGLQKLEESILEGEEEEARYRQELSIMKGLLGNLQNNVKDREVTPQRFFIATHQQLMRIISLSISGFDTPVSLWGLNE
ncbi:MAG: cytochrome-c peroxidase, partial [Bacteroidota bacterium]